VVSSCAWNDSSFHLVVEAIVLYNSSATFRNVNFVSNVPSWGVVVAFGASRPSFDHCTFFVCLHALPLLFPSLPYLLLSFQFFVPSHLSMSAQNNTSAKGPGGAIMINMTAQTVPTEGPLPSINISACRFEANWSPSGGAALLLIYDASIDRRAPSLVVTDTTIIGNRVSAPQLCAYGHESHFFFHLLLSHPRLADEFDRH